MEHLWSPWRMVYLRRDPAEAEREGCIFCEKPSENRDAENKIVYRGQKAFVILNIYPYNNGHLMIVPYQHVPSLEQLDTPTLTELMVLTNRSLAALRTAYQPHAFNIGLNIGAAGGAGIVAHVHLHVVPRWAGDTNFISSISSTRVIPEDLAETYQRLRLAWPQDE